MKSAKLHFWIQSKFLSLAGDMCLSLAGDICISLAEDVCIYIFSWRYISLAADISSWIIFTARYIPLAFGFL